MYFTRQMRVCNYLYQPRKKKIMTDSKIKIIELRNALKSDLEVVQLSKKFCKMNYKMKYKLFFLKYRFICRMRYYRRNDDLLHIYLNIISQD